MLNKILKTLIAVSLLAYLLLFLSIMYSVGGAEDTHRKAKIREYERLIDRQVEINIEIAILQGKRDIEVFKNKFNR